LGHLPYVLLLVQTRATCPAFILLRLRPGDPEGTPAVPFYKALEFLYLGEFFRSL
jgi:hypothetical protein